MKAKRKNILYKAGVLLIALVMVLSIIPAVTADTNDTKKTIDDNDNRKIEPERGQIELPPITGFPANPNVEMEYVKEGTIEDLNPATFGDVIFQQDPYFSGTAVASYWNWDGAYIRYQSYEKFWGLTDEICDMRWWGIFDMTYSPDPMLFDVYFYENDGGSPGALVESWIAMEPSTATYLGPWGYYNLWEFTIDEGDLDPCVDLAVGWVSFVFRYDLDYNGNWFFWLNALPAPNPEGDDYSLTYDGYYYDWYERDYDLAFELTKGTPQYECLECCDLEVYNVELGYWTDDIPPVFVGEEIHDEFPVLNSTPKVIKVTLHNNGIHPIGELKLLIDIFEKVCQPCIEWCDDLEKPKYYVGFDDSNENWTVFDDPADDAGTIEGFEGDRGDTWALQNDEYHSADQAYRCTKGKYLYPNAPDTYVERSMNVDDDYLEWHPANLAHRKLMDAACTKFTFWHKATGEYAYDSDDNLIMIDYGYIQYSPDDGANWYDIALSDFVAYDNPWEQVTIMFLNTAANNGHYAMVCSEGCEDYCICDDSQPNTICIYANFDDWFGPAGAATYLRVRFNWHANPCHQYEGWYIDDVCFEYCPEYELDLIFQTHKITDIGPCTIEEGPGVKEVYLPLEFDGEHCKWYLLNVTAQVFECECPYGDMWPENNYWIEQFKITDVHDIACIGMTGPSDLAIFDDGTHEHGMYEVTVKNLGSFIEDKVPVDLKVDKKMVTYPFQQDFEENADGFDAYTFIGGGCTDEFIVQWSDGVPDASFPPGPRSVLPGDECLIYGEVGSFIMLKPNICNMIVDPTLITSDPDCCEEMEYEWYMKWSIPFGDEYYIVIWVQDGPSAGLKFLTIGAEGTYENNWTRISLNVDYWSNVWGYMSGGVWTPCTFQVGHAMFTNGDGTLTIDTPAGTWGGILFDNFMAKKISPSGSPIVVDTAETGILMPGDEETVKLWWNDTAYCNWCVYGDANLPTDENTANDICCMQTRVSSIKDLDLEFDSVDLTCCDPDCLWHLCNVIDDVHMWAGDEATGLYAPNMDDSLVLTENLREFYGVGNDPPENGYALTYNTYYKIEQDFDFGEVYIRRDPTDVWTKVRTYTGNSGPFNAEWIEEVIIIPPEDCSNETQIRFRMISDPYVEDEGWYLDDICIKEIELLSRDLFENFDPDPLPPPVFFEDFETCVIPPIGWITYPGINNLGGFWGEGSTSTYVWTPSGASGCYAEADSWEAMGATFDVYLEWTLDFTGLTYSTVHLGFAHLFSRWTFDTGTVLVNMNPVATYTSFIDENAFIDITAQVNPGVNIITFHYTGWPGTFQDYWNIDNVGIYLDAPPAPVFPPAGWSMVQTSTEVLAFPAYWHQHTVPSDAYSPPNTAACWWGWLAQDEQLIINTLPALGPGEFHVLSFENVVYQTGFWPEDDWIECNTPSGLQYVGLVNDADNNYATRESFAIPPDAQDIIFHRVTPDGGMGAWILDDVALDRFGPGTALCCDTFEIHNDPCFNYTCSKTCGGDYWEYTTEYPDGSLGVWEPTHNWFCHDYPSSGAAINCALFTEIDLTDPLLAQASLEFVYYYAMETGCGAYFEISTDFEAGTTDEENCTNMLDATWIPIWQFENVWNYQTQPWTLFTFDLTDYLGGTISLRIRYTTPGNDLFVKQTDSGFAVDDFDLYYKEHVFTDEVPPVTTMVFDDLTATVSLFAYDPTGPVSSGVCATYYKLDGGAQTEYDGPFTLSEGTHTVEYWSVDCAGNEESHKNSPTLVVDTTAPTCTITQPVEGLYLFGSQILASRILGSGALCIGKIMIKVDASDSGSGVSFVHFDVDGDSGYDASAPYEYLYRGPKFGTATVTATAFDGKGLTASDEATFTIYSLGLL